MIVTQEHNLSEAVSTFVAAGFKAKVEPDKVILVMPDRTEALLFLGQGRNQYRDIVVLGWINAWFRERNIYPHPSYNLGIDVPFGMRYRSWENFDIGMGTFEMGYDAFEVTLGAALRVVRSATLTY